MKEHLSTSVEAGTVEKLQELAGGQRKIGEFLTELVALLWQHRDIVESTNLQELVIAGPKRRSDLEGEILALDAQIVEMAKRQQRMDIELSYFRAVVESAVRFEEGYTIEEYRALRKSQRSASTLAPATATY